MPSVKLVGKERVGSKLRRRYDRARTPLERLLEQPKADQAALAHLVALRNGLDPFTLSQAVERQLQRIYALSNSRDNPKPQPGSAASARTALAG